MGTDPTQMKPSRLLEEYRHWRNRAVKAEVELEALRAALINKKAPSFLECITSRFRGALDATP